jgi:hypothetical protein
MQVKLNRFSLSLLSVLVLTAVSSRQANAQFGGIVHDPINLVTLSKQLSSEVQNGATLTQQLATATKILTSSMQLYGVAMQETTFIKNKNLLLAAGFAAQNVSIAGHPAWDKALAAGGGVAAAGGVWQQMMSPGASVASRMALADSFAAAALNSIGSCQQAALANDGALNRLEGMAIDLNPASNTRANQANLSNMSMAQALRVQECQHNLQMQQAKLQLLQVQQQRTKDQEMADQTAAQAAVLNQLKVTDTVSAIKNLTDR